MDAELVQTLRYKLQRRVRRLNSTDYQKFHSSLKQFWGFLQKSTVILGIMEDLKRRFPNINQEIDPMFAKSYSEGGLLWSDEDKHAAASLYIIERCIKSDQPMIEAGIARLYSNERKFNDALESFKDYFLETLYDYID
jgi:hypothetical protein